MLGPILAETAGSCCIYSYLASFDTNLMFRDSAESVSRVKVAVRVEKFENRLLRNSILGQFITESGLDYFLRLKVGLLKCILG